MISSPIIQSDAPKKNELAVWTACDIDERIVREWLHNAESEHTRRSYRYTVDKFMRYIGKPLGLVTLSDLQAYEDTLVGAKSTRKTRKDTVKSLLTFAEESGAITFNVSLRWKSKQRESALATRILSESEVNKILAKSEGRAHTLVRLCYAGGFRISEVVALRWADVVPASDGGVFVTVLGKGDKTRTVRLSSETAAYLHEVRGDAIEAAFVFPGRDGKPIAQVTAWRAVSKAAKEAKIGRPVSPHFFRHSHASHALERGASLVLVRDTLGHASVATTDRYLHARPGESSSRYLPV